MISSWKYFFVLDISLLRLINATTNYPVIPKVNFKEHEVFKFKLTFLGSLNISIFSHSARLFPVWVIFHLFFIHSFILAVLFFL